MAHKKYANNNHEMPEVKVLFKPSEKQQEFLEKSFDDNYFYIAYGGAAGGGKTFVSLATLILFCKIYPKSRWCVIRKSLTEIKLNTIPSFFKVVPTNFIENWNKSEFICTFKNESQIIFKGENYDADKELLWMDGLEVNGFLLEQAEELSEAAFNKAKLRAGRNIIPSRPPIKILITFNPNYTWSRELFYEPYTENRLQQPFCYIPAKIEDNPYHTEEYLKQLEYLDPITKAKYMKGDWNVKIEGALFDRKDLKFFTQKDYEFYLKEQSKDEADQIIGYIDPANEGDDYLAMVIGKLFKDRLYITDVIYTQDAQDKTIPRIVKKINDIDIKYTRVETNGLGSMFIPKIREYVQASRILASHSSQNKHSRILDCYWFVTEYCYFLHESEYSKNSDYELFMRNILTYLKADDNTQDDGIDGLAGLCRFAYKAYKHLFSKKVASMEENKKS